MGERDHKLIPSLLASMVMLFVLAACGSADGTSSGGAPAGPTAAPSAPTADQAAPTGPPAGQGNPALDVLAGTKWALVSFATPDSQTPVPANAGVSAEFGAAGALGGSTGCNSYSTQLTLAGQKLTVGPIQSTEMACVEEDRMARERDFVAALQSARSIARDGDTLTIAYDGGELRFAKIQPTPNQSLEGTIWQLTTFVAGEIASSPIADTVVTAQFDGGKVSGKAGCNSYFGGYTANGGAITFSDVGSTKMACSGEIMTQEQTFLKALAEATGYAIAGDQLTIDHPGGQLMFTASRQ
jgi:heat shock protein HslJ